MKPLLPLFLDLEGRRVLLVGGGAVAAAKLQQLMAVRAEVSVVAPEICEAIERAGVPVERRAFRPSDVHNVWLVIAAAIPDVNRRVVEAANVNQVFVNAVDDPANATAFMGGVVRRDGVTVAVSTNGEAPALAGLLRQAIDAVLPRELHVWMREARRQRILWRRAGVAMEARRPLLLDALNDLYKARTSDQPARKARSRSSSIRRAAKPTVGRVVLVGAGPGDPGLLTRRAVAELRSADVVLYDALVDRRVLKLARRAQRFFVGKRAGRRVAMTQQAIHTVMIRAARRGKNVIRLKGGDPFLFGRGGEEAQALLAAGIPLEVVPGVTSAVAAPALAGIPVTHRGLSSALLIVGGHDEEAFTSALEHATPRNMTVVVLMGIARRADLAHRLIARGWSAATPAAIIVDASKPGQSVWLGTLDLLAGDHMELESDGPGTIIVGEVVSLASAAGFARGEHEHRAGAAEMAADR